MNIARALLALLLALMAEGAIAARSFSLHPAIVVPGQSAVLRIDDTDGCYEFDQHTVKRTGNTVDVEILASDLVTMPCLPEHVTPILLPLGTFEAGDYAVVVRVCGNFPVDPCGAPTTLSLSVGGMARRSTIPVGGGVAMLLMCAGIMFFAASARATASRMSS